MTLLDALSEWQGDKVARSNISTNLALLAAPFTRRRQAVTFSWEALAEAGGRLTNLLRELTRGGYEEQVRGYVRTPSAHH